MNSVVKNELPRSITFTSWLLDSSIPLPGGFRVGLDGLLGLIPGVGDTITGSFSAVIILKAYQMGAPVSVLARMLLNTLIDTAVGFIPLVGDLFDFAFKANTKNVKLLQDHLDNPPESKNKSRLFLFFSFAVIALIVGLACWMVFTVLSIVWHALWG